MFMDFGSSNFGAFDSSCRRNDTCENHKMNCGEYHSESSCDCNGAKQNSGCGMTNVNTFGIINYPLASVYAPIQKFHKLFDKETALNKGTAFEELDLPFMGESIYKGGCSHG